MEKKHEENLENNKEIDNIDSHERKLSYLLLPKKDYHVNRDKLNFNNEIDEKKFYKTSGKGFSFGRNNKKFNTNSFLNPKSNMFNQKRVHSSTIDKQKLYNPKVQNGNIYNHDNGSNNIVNTLQKRITEIENELEHNENTFTHNKKILQKRLEEKDQEIQKLTKIIAEKDENNLKEKEISLNNLKKKYINEIKEITNENMKLKNRNEELTIKSDEDDERIKELEEKNKKLREELNLINKKYDSFIINDEKNVFEDDIKELIKKYDDKLTEDQNEINSLNEEITYLNQENKKLKFLTKEIIEARNETEIFFLEALNEVKRDLYKIKKEKDKRGSFFPTLKKNYETNVVKVDIRTLTPEMRERVLRNLFEKINKGYDESKYRELNNIMAVDINDDEDGF